MSIFSAALTLNKHTDQPWEAYLGESAVLQEPKASFPPHFSLKLHCTWMQWHLASMGEFFATVVQLLRCFALLTSSTGSHRTILRRRSWSYMCVFFPYFLKWISNNSTSEITEKNTCQACKDPISWILQSGNHQKHCQTIELHKKHHQ